MRIVWVSRAGTGAEDQGDNVYDRKMCAALAGGHEIEPLATARLGRARQLVGAAVHLSAPETFVFGGAEAARIAEAVTVGRADAVVFSHEHLDRLAAQVRRLLGPGAPAFLTIRHNVTSDAMRHILADAGPAADAYALLARRQERAALAGPLFEGIVALSHRDRALLAGISGRKDIALAMPGAPPAAPLAPDARIAREVVLTGTYGWFPKARDLRRFIAEATPAVLGDVALTAEASVFGADAPPGLRIVDGGRGDALRFGVITDRFTAGHKLKTAAYIVQNCIVLTYADVAGDFSFSPAAAQFIRRIAHARDIAPIVDKFSVQPADALCAAFAAFKAEVAAALTWTGQAAEIEAAIAAAVSRPAAQASRTA